MAYTKDDLDTKLAEANTAIGASSWVTARTALMQAKVILAGLPNYAIGNRRVEYRDEISSIIKDLDAADSSSSSARKNRRVFSRFTRE